jgi:hypothetical protein
MTAMRRLIAVGLVVGGVAMQACAQRGGSRASSAGHSSGFAGYGGSFASRSIPAFRVSSSLRTAPQLSESRYGGATANLRQPNSYRGPVYAGPHRYRRPYVPSYGVGVPYSVGAWFGPHCMGFQDCGLYGDDAAYAPPAPDAGHSAAEYDAQAQATPSDSFRPAYERQRTAVEPEPEEATTLVFKDGRPAETIHNYILTRTTLYVRDEMHRELAVADLDLAATQKVNKAAGVSFQLPGAAR